MALPIQARGRLQGVLFVESPLELRFSYDDEDAMAILAGQVGLGLQDLEDRPEAEEPEPAESPAPASGHGDRPLVVRHFAEDDSIFLDGDYLIKGVAGSIFWAMVRDHVAHQRVAFSNRELRLDPRIRLPDLSDNLEARLVLLGRRLVERGACVRMEKTGRGRFQLRIGRSLELVEVPLRQS
jgi:adenylate cyclase